MQHFQTRLPFILFNVEIVPKMLSLTEFLSLNPQLAQYEPPQEEKHDE